VRARFGAFVLDSASRQLLREGRDLSLSPKALDLLILLVERQPHALTKRELHERLWPDTFVVDANLSNLVAELRAALQDSAREPRFIRTVHRYGYAFTGALDEEQDVSTPGDRLASCSLEWQGGRVALGEGDHLIGREPGVAARITDPSVSRHHARLHIVGGRATLHDLGSKNGTFVGDRPIASATQLADGDEIVFGSFRVVFRILRREPSTRTVVSRRS
jgi:DNA-binding winged helix-turn-helix (wHTH) protein